MNEIVTAFHEMRLRIVPLHGLTVMPPLHRSEPLMYIQCSQALIAWFVRKDHHLVLRRSLSAVAEGRRRGRAANGRRNTELLSHWAL